MRVEIDISPQFGQNSDLFLGMGGAIEDCICLSKKDYRVLFHLTSAKEETRGRRSRKKSRTFKNQKIRVYSIMCFLLLKPHLSKVTHIDVDRDFYGHRDVIQTLLNNMINKAGLNSFKFQINAGAIAGKGSAHIIANNARLGRGLSRNVSAEEIFEYY